MKLLVLASLRPSIYGYTWEIAKHLRSYNESHSAITSFDSYASLVLSNLPLAYTTRRTHANHDRTDS